MKTGRVRALTAIVVVIACSESTGPRAPASLSIDPHTLDLAPLDSFRLTAVILDRDGQPISDAKVTWTSRNPSVVSVDPTGEVTALATAQPVNTRIVASIGSMADSAFVLVATTVASVVIRGPASPDTLYWPLGATQYTAAALDPSGAEIPNVTFTWTVSDSSLVSLKQVGNSVFPTILGVGSTSISATGGGKSATVAVVGALSPTAAIFVWPDTSRILIGMKRTLRPRRSATANAFAPWAVGASWRSSDSSVAVVDGSGVVTGVGDGRATITAVFPDRSVSAEVQVFHYPVPLTLHGLTAGQAHVCGLSDDGTAYCWGTNASSQLGTDAVMDRCGGGLAPVRCSEAPVAVNTPLRFVSITAGDATTCGLTSSGAAYCWGYNEFGTTGTGLTDSFVRAPTLVVGGHAFSMLSGGIYTMCGVDTSGVGYCWGGNSSGQLGDGTTTTRRTPAQVVGGQVWRVIEAGNAACGITTDSLAYCWGLNFNGQAGVATTPCPGSGCITSPSALFGSLHFSQLAPSKATSISCGVTTTPDMYCWGFGSRGSFDIVADQWRPSVVALNVRYSVNRATPCFVDQLGSVYCRGTPANTLATPAFIPSSPSFAVRELVQGGLHSCATDADKTTWCWDFSNPTGFESFFWRSFNGILTGSTTPTKVPGQR